MQLDEVTALVTGGASGLGRAVCRRLSSQGARVVAVDLAPPAAGTGPANAWGERVRFVAADVTDETALAHAIEIAQASGEFRVAVSCAGIAPAARVVGRAGPHAQEVFTHTLDVNLTGTFNVLRLAAAAMADLPEVGGERGVVIMTASVAAFDGQVGQVAYSASKAAVVGMTLPAARDLASSAVRVMTIAPGTFSTPMLEGLPEETRAGLAQDVPHPHRLGDPDEYARLVQHIIENPYLNGETIRIDGALRMPVR